MGSLFVDQFSLTWLMSIMQMLRAIGWKIYDFLIIIDMKQIKDRWILNQSKEQNWTGMFKKKSNLDSKALLIYLPWFCVDSRTMGPVPSQENIRLFLIWMKVKPGGGGVTQVTYVNMCVRKVFKWTHISEVHDWRMAPFSEPLPTGHTLKDTWYTWVHTWHGVLQAKKQCIFLKICPECCTFVER